MSLEFNPSTDFAAVTDGTEPVTLVRRGRVPGATETVVPHALRRAVATAEARVSNRYNTQKQAPSGGRYTASDATWHLSCAELPDGPRPGDTILDGAGRRWTILEVQRATLGARWQCAARNLAVACGLDDTITILIATYHKGSGGAAEPAWVPWRTGVRARIQPAAVDMAAGPYARQTAARYQVFLEEDVPLNHTHRIQGPDGTIYRVNGTLGAQRIGELQTIDVEVLR